jgi:hypothetical protein
MNETKPHSQQVGEKSSDQGAIILATRLVRSDLAWMGRPLLQVLRWSWRHRTITAEHGTTSKAPLPVGPFRTTRPQHLGDLLLWVPRAIDSVLIDELTGGFGYSHATIDTGEIDLPTGKPVMAEITIGQTVERKFQQQYGARPFVRVPLSRGGVDVQQFIRCVNSKMGEQYDRWDALTLGQIHDPAREVCSGLVADCLPEKELQRIAWAKRLGLLHRHSVSLHSRLDALHVKAFVSPNGFAEFYGVPRGSKVTMPDTLVVPRPVDSSMTSIAGTAAKRHGWKVAVGVGMALLLGLTVIRRKQGG